MHDHIDLDVYRGEVLGVVDIQVDMIVQQLVAEAVDQAAHPDDRFFVRWFVHIPSTENMTEKAASSTITRKTLSTTERVVKSPTLAALRSTWKPS